MDACKFKDFWILWKGLEGNADLKTLIQNTAIEGQLRHGIVDVLALSYRAAPMDVVQAALNVTAVDAKTYPKIESVSATQVLFVATADNTKRSRVFQEGLKFSAISSFVTANQ